jgi:hypothetical protein
LDSEKREACACPKLQLPIDVAVLAIEGMEKTGEDLGREARCLRKPLMIRLEDIERPYRKQHYLK